MGALLPQSVRRVAGRALWAVSPVWWANLGPLSRVIARRIPTLGPPVWVVSMPRSGSSWVGAVLGGGRDAFYLREPANQTHLVRGGASTVFEVRPPDVPPGYSAAVRSALLGLPAFPYKVVGHPMRWGLSARRRRRLVIKEVNPLALEWLVGVMDDPEPPRVIYLVRHPAAVAASLFRMGWTGARLAERFPAARLSQVAPGHEDLDDSFWIQNGAFQAVVLRLALAALEGHPAWRLVRYEDLCRDPEGIFRDLFGFAGLTWDDGSAGRVAAHSGAGGTADRADAYGTRRDSAAMAEAWRGLEPEVIAGVREGWQAMRPPLYGPDDW